LALLSAAYGRAVASSVLGNIKRAAKAWGEGDDCLAYIHLAHAGLPALQDQVEAARRLFVADGFMKAGTSPRAVFQALGFGAAYIDAVVKLFNPDQPRVPAGSGRTSGQWTRELSGDEQGANGGEDQADAQRAVRESPAPTATESTINGRSLSLLGPTPAAAPESVSMGARLLSWMADLDAVQIAELGAYASRVLTPAGAAALVFGILFVPSPNNIRVEGEVADIPGLRYSWNSDELTLHLTQYEEDRARQYEDFLKNLINPDAPTPSGYVYYLPKPKDGEPVSYDDCQKKTTILFEYKGGYGNLLMFRSNAVYGFLDQSARQIAASGGRPVVWIFADKEDALRTQELFKEAKEGRQYITIVHVPWTTGATR
jgi:hypothetical protein